MGGRKFQYLTIFLTVFIDVLGFGIVIPVLPLYAEHFGASGIQIGLLVGIFSLMQFLFAPVWGRLSDRFGRKPILIVGTAGTVAGYLVMGFAGSLAVLFFARLLAGVAGANIGVAQAYLADISAPENRARAMGLIGAAFGLGFVFGPAVGGLASSAFGYSAPMFVAAALGVVNFAFVIVFLPESRLPQPREKTGDSKSGLLAHIDPQRFGATMIVYFTVISGFSIMTTIFALYLLHRFGLGVRDTGWILAGIGLLGAFVQGGLIGRLAKRFGEMNLAFAGAVVMMAGLAGLGLTASIPWMLVSTAAVGLGNSLLMPSLSSMASQAANPEWQGRALGILQSAGSLARFLGPLAAGILLAMESANPNSLYASLPLLFASGILVISCLAIAALAWTTRTVKGP
jgi:MFS transporter, DHA1 family, tetracycline resistance protein